jgi:hypothetical protein
MAGWVQLETATWDDEHFAALSGDAKLIFLWAWSNKAATICGIYPATQEQIAIALAPPVKGPLPAALEDRVYAALVELGVKPMLAYDYDHQVIWVTNRALKANRSPKVLVAMQREFGAVPWSPLKDQFAVHYPAIATTGAR